MKNLQKKKTECYFCANKIEHIDYKDMYTLKRYTNSFAKIKPRRYTGNCGKHQRQLTTAIKQSRFMALIPYVMH